VVLGERDLNLDLEATRQLRAKIRAQELEGAR